LIKHIERADKWIGEDCGMDYRTCLLLCLLEIVVQGSLGEVVCVGKCLMM